MMGDAKIAGRVVLVDDLARLHSLSHGSSEAQQDEVAAGGLLSLDITEVALTRLGTPPDHLVIESWHPRRGLERIERR